MIKYNNLYLNDNSKIYGNAKVSKCVNLYDNSEIYGNSKVSNYVYLIDNSEIYGNAIIKGDLKNNITIKDNIKIYGNVEINIEILKELNCCIDKYNNYYISGDFEIYDYKTLKSAISIMNIKNGI